MNIQITGARLFINRLSRNMMTEAQVNRAVAYLRAKHVVFYDNWSKDHAIVIYAMEMHKSVVLDSLRVALRYQ